MIIMEPILYYIFFQELVNCREETSHEHCSQESWNLMIGI